MQPTGKFNQSNATDRLGGVFYLQIGKGKINLEEKAGHTFIAGVATNAMLSSLESGGHGTLEAVQNQENQLETDMPREIIDFVIGRDCCTWRTRPNHVCMMVNLFATSCLW